MSLLNKYLQGTIAELGAAESAEVSVSWRGDDDQDRKEKLLHKLGLLGIVTDYTIDYHRQCFDIAVSKPTREQLYRRLVEHVSPPLPRTEAEEECKTILKADDPTEQAVENLIRFTYSHLVSRRKESLRYMAELCRDFKGSEEFRKGILYHLEESEFTKALEKEKWSAEDKGPEDLAAATGQSRHAGPPTAAGGRDAEGAGVSAGAPGPASVVSVCEGQMRGHDGSGSAGGVGPAVRAAVARKPDRVGGVRAGRGRATSG